MLGTHWRRLLGLETWSTALQRSYNTFSTERFIGVYDPLGHPGYMIREPILAKRIIMEASDYFSDRAFGTDGGNGVDQLLSGSVEIWSKDEWRIKRTISDGGIDMDQLMTITYEYATKMVENLVAIEGQVSEVSGVISSFAGDIMAVRCFGLLRSGTNKEFTTRIKCLKEMSGLKRWAYRCAPVGMNRLLEDTSNIRYFRQLVNNADSTVTPNLAGALKTLKNQDAEDQCNGNCFYLHFYYFYLHFLYFYYLANQNDDTVSQCLHFYLAGSKYLVRALSCMVHELTLNPSLQLRLYDEIAATDRKLNGHSPTRDNLTQMKYMSMMVSEVLRRWPVSSITDCIVTRPYTIEKADGTTFELNEGDGILFPSHSWHMDAEYYSMPERFDPERFSEANRNEFRNECYFPFGNEPVDELTLICLKMAVYQLVLKLELQKCKKTQDRLKLDDGDVLSAVSRLGFWTDVKKRA